jgi:proline dehydrogenase
MVLERIFDNTKIAFSLKNDKELKRAYFLFKMISINLLVRIGTVMTHFALKMHFPVEGIIRSTVFDHFCGGINEKDCSYVIDKMFQKGVSSVLDYAVEGKENEAEFNDTMQTILRIIDFSKGHNKIPFAVFKPSSLGRFHLYEKKSNGESLTKKEQEEWNAIVNRFDTICNKAIQNDVAVLIDAEESWIQNAADDLITEMMQKYNINKPVVYNTLQMYRCDRLDFLKHQHNLAKSEGFYLGYKLVRGAYMEKENDRANDKSYTSPICSSKSETDQNFNEGLKYIVKNIDTISLFSGTHNEESSYLLMALMKAHHLENKDKRIWFGQLYGMSDNISFNLAHHGYNVAKYLPFGPVKDVMPYLIRRAEENTSVIGQTSRELNLINKERQRRKLNVRN